MLPKLVLNSWAQAICLPQPPKVLGLQALDTAPSLYYCLKKDFELIFQFYALKTLLHRKHGAGICFWGGRRRLAIMAEGEKESVCHTNQWIGSCDYSHWISARKRMMQNRVYLELLLQKLSQILLLLPERTRCRRFGWKQTDLHHLQSYSHWRCQSSELSSHSLIWRPTLYMLNCFPAELMHVLLVLCKYTPQELHFLAAIKKVYQPPRSVSWNPINKRPRVWEAGYLLANLKPSARPQEHGQPTPATLPAAPPTPRGTQTSGNPVGSSQGRPSHPLRGAGPADSRASQLPPPRPSRSRRGRDGPQSAVGRQNGACCLGTLPHSPAPEEDVVRPGHRKGDELLQLPVPGPALGVGSFIRASRGSAASGSQVPGVAEQKIPAVAPVFVSLAVAAQRLHPGGHPRVLAQVLRHVLRHVGPAGREHSYTGRQARRAGASGPVPAACTGGPLENAPSEAQTPNNSSWSSRTAHFRPPPPSSLL
ncbi:hypothetical protein AAY473_036624 [Plecturocebus cupreus]